MCDECGCSSPGTDGGRHRHDQASVHEHEHVQESRLLRIEADLLAKNNRLAAANRARFQAAGVTVLNLVSSPGAGKTTLLEKTLTGLRRTLSFAVLEGDQQTSRDAERIAVTGVPVRQINTGAGCHLDAHQVAHGCEAFDLDRTDVLMIENVGNLICPAGFDLGEDRKVILLSVTEGEDKPLKYPFMFQAASLLLISKVDLLPHLDFDLERCRAFARQVNPHLEIMEISCHKGAGLLDWFAWLEERVARNRKGSGGRVGGQRP
jgi:hydrogenase nickel incorporation protein HypB